MTSSKFTFDGGQVKVRSKKVKFSNQNFCIKTRVSEQKFLHDFKHAVSCLLRCVELPNIASQEIDVILVSLYIDMKTQKWIVLKFSMCIFRMQFFNILHAFLISRNLGFYNRFFSKEPFFDIFK